MSTQHLTSIGDTSIAVFEPEPADGRRLVEYLQKKGFKVSYLDSALDTVHLVRRTSIPVVVISITESLDELTICRALMEGAAPPVVIGLSDRDLRMEINSRLSPKHMPNEQFVRPVSFHKILHAIEQELAERDSESETPPPLLFPQTLAQLWKDRKTGMLRVTTEGLQTTIYIHQGTPVFADQGSLGDTLGRLLLKSGKITQDQFSKAVELITERLVDNEQLRLGEALVKLGFLTADEVLEALAEQIQAKIIACFSLERFHFDFKAGAEHLEGVGRFEVSFERLMMKGIKNHVTPARLDLHLEALVEGFPSLCRPLEEVAKLLMLSRQEQSLLRSLDGRKPLRLLISTSALDPVHSSQVLVVLLLLDFVELAEEAEAARPDPTVKLSTVPPATQSAAAPPPRERTITRPPKPASRLHDMVMSMYLRFKGRSDWDDLEVRQNATQEEIEISFSSISRRLETLREQSPADRDSQRKIDEMTSHLQQVKERLLAGKPRSASTLDSGDSRQDKLKAEEAFQDGVALMEAGDMGKAGAAFRRAVDLHPGATEYRMYLVWMRYRTTRKKDAQARARRDVRNLAHWVAVNNQSSAHANLILGTLSLEDRKYDSARKYLEAAAGIAPDDEQIARLLKKLEAKSPGRKPRRKKR